MSQQSRAVIGLALTPVLALAAAAPAALAAPGTTAAATAAAATSPLVLGPWSTAKELAATTHVLGMRNTKGGTVVALLEQKAADGTRVVTQVRPAGSTTWLAAQPAPSAAGTGNGTGLGERAGGDLTTLDDGSVALLWREPADGGQVTLRLARLADGTTSFGAAESVASVPAATFFKVAGNASGKLAVAFADADRKLTVTERAADGAWTAPVVADTLPAPIERPDHSYTYWVQDLEVAVDAGGTTLVVWGGNSKYKDEETNDPTAWKLAYRAVEHPAGGAWQQPVDPGFGEHAQGVTLAALPQGGFHWFTNGAYGRKAAGATAWAPVEAVEVSSDRRSHATLLTAPNGDVSVLGVAGSSTSWVTSGTPEHQVRPAATGKWAPSHFIAGSAVVGDQGSLRAAPAAGGAVVATWAQKTYTTGTFAGTQLMTATYANGTWSRPTALGTGITPTTGVDTAYPRTELAVDDKGRPVAAWTQQTYDQSAEPADRYTNRSYLASTTARPLPAWHDFTGDGRADVLALSDNTAGNFRVFSKGATGLASDQLVTGWPKDTVFQAFGDADGDRCNDVFVRTGSGEARMYTPTCGALPTPGSAYKRISTNWKAYDAFASGGDLTGDGKADLVAREAASGSLYLYPGNGTGGFGSRIRVGGGWNTYKKLIGAGDLNGDGRADLLALDGSGELWRYNGTGKSTAPYTARALVFKDWGGSYTQVVGAGDVNGDGKADLVSRTTGGNAWLNAGNGKGGFAGRTAVSTTAIWKSYPKIG
ncbi:VCBS repeat-containing protein [Streptomyces sp. NPDC089919]|uniref:FG-GAP repeat domain-containing protein n=1 Tax=Streptomyces sp. NPDC089919 TaxID=3155188 RepID=UPI003438C55D